MEQVKQAPQKSRETFAGSPKIATTLTLREDWSTPHLPCVYISRVVSARTDNLLEMPAHYKHNAQNLTWRRSNFCAFLGEDEQVPETVPPRSGRAITRKLFKASAAHFDSSACNPATLTSISSDSGWMVAEEREVDTGCLKLEEPWRRRFSMATTCPHWWKPLLL